MRRRPADASAVPVLVLLLAATLPWVGACGEAPAPEESGRRVQEPRDGTTGSATPARYRTQLAFVPFAEEGPSLYLRLEQTARFDRLERRYRGWTMEGGRARTLFSMADTLPVPRAGWRVLPAAGLRVMAGGDGRIQGVVLGDTAAPLRLVVDSSLVEWSGITGQRERLAGARTIRGGDTVPGVLLQRRQARPLEATDTPGDAGFLLVAGPPAVGAAVLLASGQPGDTAAAVHALQGQTLRSWNEVGVRGPDRGSDGGPPAWELRPDPEGPSLRLRAPAGEVAGGVAPAAVEGTLGLEGAPRPVAGLVVSGG